MLNGHRKEYLWVFVIVSLFCFVSCGNGTVQDVTLPMIRLLSPIDGARDLGTTVTLTWEATPSGAATPERPLSVKKSSSSKPDWPKGPTIAGKSRWWSKLERAV